MEFIHGLQLSVEGCALAPALFLCNVISSDSCVVSSTMFLILFFIAVAFSVCFITHFPPKNN